VEMSFVSMRRVYHVLNHLSPSLNLLAEGGSLSHGVNSVSSNKVGNIQRAQCSNSSVKIPKVRREERVLQTLSGYSHSLDG